MISWFPWLSGDGSAMISPKLLRISPVYHIFWWMDIHQSPFWIYDDLCGLPPFHGISWPSSTNKTATQVELTLSTLCWGWTSLLERASEAIWAVAAIPLLIDDELGDYTTQYIGDCNNPIGESLQTNQYNGIVKGFWILFISVELGCGVVNYGYLGILITPKIYLGILLQDFWKDYDLWTWQPNILLEYTSADSAGFEELPTATGDVSWCISWCTPTAGSDSNMWEFDG